MAILPPVDKPPFSQKKEQAGKDGTPHRPLLPERLQEITITIENGVMDKKSTVKLHFHEEQKFKRLSCP